MNTKSRYIRRIYQTRLGGWCVIIIPNFSIVGRVGVVLLQPQFTVTVTLFLLQPRRYDSVGPHTHGTLLLTRFFNNKRVHGVSSHSKGGWLGLEALALGSSDTPPPPFELCLGNTSRAVLDVGCEDHRR
jgi:hypothetical protein